VEAAAPPRCEPQRLLAARSASSDTAAGRSAASAQRGGLPCCPSPASGLCSPREVRVVALSAEKAALTAGRGEGEQPAGTLATLSSRATGRLAAHRGRAFERLLCERRPGFVRVQQSCQLGRREHRGRAARRGAPACSVCARPQQTQQPAATARRAQRHLRPRGAAPPLQLPQRQPPWLQVPEAGTRECSKRT